MHRYKPLVSQESGHPVREDAVKFLESVLCAVVDAARNIIDPSLSAVSCGEIVFLKKEIIDWIVSELVAKDCVETHIFFEQKN